MKKTNIAFLIGSLGCGGAERQVVELVNTLDEKLYNCFVIVLWDCKNGFKNRLNKNVTYFSLQFRKRYFFYGITKLVLYIYRYNIKILHSHMYTSNLISSIASIFLPNCILITGEHGKNEWKKWYHHLFEKKIISKCASMRITASDDIRKMRIKHDGVNPHSIRYIPNGTSVKKNTVDNKKKPRIIGSLGRLVSVKDFPTLISAVKLLYYDGYSLQLKIAGLGDAQAELERFIISQGLGDVVELLGYQKSEEFLQSIEIFAMSSLREGIPLALLEAMSYGLPCVATRVGGIPDVVCHEENGLLSSPRDVLGLSKNIARCVDDQKMRIVIGENAKKTIYSKFSIERMAKNYTHLYSDLQKSMVKGC